MGANEKDAAAYHPAIHEPCALNQCGGCTAQACVTRRPEPTPVAMPVYRQAWHETDEISGNGC